MPEYKYNLCLTERNSYFIECVKNDVCMYNRTDATLFSNVIDTFCKLDVYEGGFEMNSGAHCNSWPYSRDYTKIASFNNIEELQENHPELFI